GSSYHSRYTLWSALLFCCAGAGLLLCSFPTRRSSDLAFLGSNAIENAGRFIIGYGRHRFEKQQHVALAHMADEQRAIRALQRLEDRKSTRLNSSHVSNSYAVFCVKKKITYIQLRDAMT